MRQLLLLLPIACVVYFAWRSMRSRVYLLGIPFLMFLKEAVFFDRMKVFWVPGRLDPNLLAFGWLIVVWIICCDVLLPAHRRTAKRPFGPRALPEEYLLIAVALLLVLGVMVSTVRYGDAAASVQQAAGLAYMLGGYLLVRGILCASSRQEVIGFLKAIVVVNTIAAVLFILHQGMQLNIYGAPEYFSTVFQGQVITRTFVFLPALLFLALAVSMAARRWTAWTLVVVLVSLVAIWLSYTRTMLVAAVVMVVVPVLVRALKGGQAALVMRRAVWLGFAAVVTVAVLAAAFPTQSRYFVSRIDEAGSTISISETRNIQLREDHFLTIYDHVLSVDPLFGVGFAPAGEDALWMAMTRWTSDSAWVGVIYLLGVSGVVLFAGVIAAFAVRALMMALDRDAVTEYLGLIWFPYFVALALGSFIGFAFMDPTRWALNLWPFAFAAAAAVGAKAAATATMPDAVHPDPGPNTRVAALGTFGESRR